MNTQESPRLEEIRRSIQKKEEDIRAKLVGGIEATNFFSMVEELEEEIEIKRDLERTMRRRVANGIDTEDLDWEKEFHPRSGRPRKTLELV